MEFRNGKCPKCHGELQMPVEHENIICMYCGEKIQTEAAVRCFELAGSKQVPYLQEADLAACKKAADVLDAGLLEMLHEIEKPISAFTRKNYADNFSAYCKKYQGVIDALDTVYDMSDDSLEQIKTTADHFVDKVQEYLDNISKKRMREEQLLDYNMTMVVFFFPALLEQHSVSGKELAKIIAASWKEHFPQTNLEPASYERINGGFKRRFCYITTAVCESLNKPDDCYELNVLRNYRDGYLMQLRDGEELVKRYYDIAPTIVKHINKMKHRKEIYHSVWTEYLSPCIRLIEADRNEECMQRYQDMVYNLKEKYFS